MAIAGGAVPCAIVDIHEGKARSYYHLFANGDVVLDDMDKALGLVIGGQSVMVHRYERINAWISDNFGGKPSLPGDNTQTG